MKRPALFSPSLLPGTQRLNTGNVSRIASAAHVGGSGPGLATRRTGLPRRCATAVRCAMPDTFPSVLIVADDRELAGALTACVHAARVSPDVCPVDDAARRRSSRTAPRRRASHWSPSPRASDQAIGLARTIAAQCPCSALVAAVELPGRRSRAGDGRARAVDAGRQRVGRSRAGRGDACAHGRASRATRCGSAPRVGAADRQRHLRGDRPLAGDRRRGDQRARAPGPRARRDRRVDQRPQPGLRRLRGQGARSARRRAADPARSRIAGRIGDRRPAAPPVLHDLARDPRRPPPALRSAAAASACRCW